MFNFSKAGMHKRRLESLGANLADLSEDMDLDSEAIVGSEKNLDLKLVAAGYIDRLEQSRIKNVRNIVLLFATLSSGIFGGYFFRTPISSIVGMVLGLYMATLIWMIWLKLKAQDILRSSYFDLPLILEELILLIESGLGLFPAMEKVCQIDEGDESLVDIGLSRKVFKKAFNLAVHGMPISQAFSVVSKSITCVPLRQVLIHLDVSASIGGELLTSLRALSDQVHKEWKLQVETRVKKLENIVVFPVFMAVMGLLLLTSAVPLVPVFEFMSSLNKGTVTGGIPKDATLGEGIDSPTQQKLGGL